VVVQPWRRSARPSESALYSSSGTRSLAQAASTGVTTRQDSSASSLRIDRAGVVVSVTGARRQLKQCEPDLELLACGSSVLELVAQL
jgi:hypothetical protein